MKNHDSIKDQFKGRRHFWPDFIPHYLAILHFSFMNEGVLDGVKTVVAMVLP